MGARTRGERVEIECAVCAALLIRPDRRTFPQTPLLVLLLLLGLLLVLLRRMAFRESPRERADRVSHALASSAGEDESR